MSAPPVALRLTQVGKRYAVYASAFGRLASWFGADPRALSEFWAVRDVSFEARAGEAVALIGQNGAGKSTLLKLVTGTVRPTTGRIEVAGRVSAILELGLGFNPDLTGRQNVHQAGGLLGHTAAELDAFMPWIEDFTELGAFLDEPLRVYSSGMQARLAFALATARRPEVLIVDEVLSVGDAYFQHKSFERIRRMKDEGTTLLFVTHAMSDVRALCDRAILLDKGAVAMDGPPDLVTDYYNALISEKENARLTIEQRRRKDGWLTTRSGTFEAKVVELSLTDAQSGEEVAVARVGQKLRLRVVAQADADLAQIIIGCWLRDRAGHSVWGTNTFYTGQVVHDVKKGERIVYLLDFPCDIGVGSYSWSNALASSESHITDNYEWTDNALVFEVVNADRDYFVGSSWLPARFTIERGGATVEEAPVEKPPGAAPGALMALLDPEQATNAARAAEAAIAAGQPREAALQAAGLGEAAYARWRDFLPGAVAARSLVSQAPHVRAEVFDGLWSHEEMRLLHVETAQERLLVNSRDRVVSRGIYIAGEFDFAKFETALALLRDKRSYGERLSLLVDVGANIGSICVPAARRGLTDRVLAIEPHPVNARILRANIALNGLEGRIEVLEAAVSSGGESEITLELSEDNWGDHRIFVSSEQGAYGEAQRRHVAVKATRLDDALVETPEGALIWMDIQGYEGHALAGATRLLAGRPPLVLEFWPYGMRRAQAFDAFREGVARYTGFFDLEKPERFRPIGELDDLWREIGEDGAFTDVLAI